eukprot:NODE_81_length_2550_cov_185.441823_g62_i0.p2 GENE.NODE_81_length_2550_cov_185.441823_g62_i0~~NODE_81_length_2550_cov_185.441823_g62_i0.p2  ORF type:complete len:393 (-),score=121.83 NODE_81_length_2550_cov_185.441823_g62_i0:217-1395(-)
MNVCLDLFFQYDMNNLLHILVDEFVTSCLVSENTELLQCLFRDCNILQRLVDASDAESLTSGQPKCRRKGYFGHITSMSNKIVQAEEHYIVKEHTQNNEAWQAYIAGALAVRNAIDSSVLGGPAPEKPELNGPAPSTTKSIPTPSKTLAELSGVPTEAGETGDTLPISPTLPPSQKYAAPTATTSTSQEEKLEDGPDVLDQDFDARGAFTDLSEQVENQEQEVWQEREIVDKSLAGDTWANFEEANAATAAATATAQPTATATAAAVREDEDSSSSEEDGEFVPSPQKAEMPAGDGEMSDSHTAGEEPEVAPSSTSPSSSVVATTPASGPCANSVAAAIASTGPSSSSSSSSSSSVDQQEQFDNATSDAPDLGYNDFNFWRPQWDNVCSPLT